MSMTIDELMADLKKLPRHEQEIIMLGMMEEEAKMQNITDKVRRRVGVHERIKVGPNIKTLLGEGSGVIGISNEGYMQYDPGLSFDMTEEMIAGMVAHEMGHWVNDPRNERFDELPVEEQHKREYAADQFAWEYGFGPGLVKAFEKIIRLHPQEAFMTGDHPALVDRIARLNEYDRSRKEAA